MCLTAINILAKFSVAVIEQQPLGKETFSTKQKTKGKKYRFFQSKT